MKTLFSFFKKNRTVAALLVALQIPLFGNNVQVTNLTVVNPTTLRFDLSWENSWRVNYGTDFDSYDGIYIFFKYRPTGDGSPFLSAPLGTSGLTQTPMGFDAPAVANSIGIFIYPSAATYSGNPTMTNVQANLASPLPFNVDVRAYAVEMVYVAATNISPCTSANGFYIGDGNGSQESARAFHVEDNTSALLSIGQLLKADAGNAPWDDNDMTNLGVQYEAACGNGVSWSNGSNYQFPIGKKAFWAMKYEISQAGYRDFLNSLALNQQINRVATNITGGTVGSPALLMGGTNRNYIELKTLGNNSDGTPATFGCDANDNNVFDEATDGEWVACNGISFRDVTAYLDWAGLTCMTELQFEKLARGANQPTKLGEFAWGSTSIFTPPGSAFTITNPSANNETVNASATLGNASWYYSYPSAPFDGPFRNGIFGTANSTRVTSGASFYGAMELTGNVSELCVTLGNFLPRTYCSANAFGDGILSVAGEQTTYALTGAEGHYFFIYRGGSWNSPAANLRVSDRSGGFPDQAASRTPYIGGRGIFNIN